MELIWRVFQLVCVIAMVGLCAIAILLLIYDINAWKIAIGCLLAAFVCGCISKIGISENA